MVRLRATAGAPRQTARALLTATAAWCAGPAAGAVTVTRSPAGAPVLGGGAAGLHASVSHTRGLAAVAICRLGPVGIDVEAMRPLPALALSRRWFAAEDTEWLLGQPEERRVTGFLLLWTAKEAVGKVYGTGLRGGAVLGLRTAAPRTCVPAWCWQPTVDDPDVVVAHRELPGFLLALAARPAVDTGRCHTCVEVR